MRVCGRSLEDHALAVRGVQADSVASAKFWQFLSRTVTHLWLYSFLEITRLLREQVLGSALEVVKVLGGEADEVDW